jgi:lysophospholipase L1-like esterase
MSIKSHPFFRRPGWFGLFVFIAGLIILSNAITAASPGIRIDNQNRRLTAPQGETYQWYLNGTILSDQRQQNINVKKSGEYMVEITDENGRESVEFIRVYVTQSGIHRIYIIGDSTVATYQESSYPQKGWGQIFQLFFDRAQIEVINKSIGGRSSRSFYEEGRWTEVVNSLESGDYVFIQFGHNDRDWTKPERYTDTAAYKDYLRIYVKETRAKDAYPVLVSPMIMHAYRGTVLRNVFTENENDYRGAMLQVALELDAPFVDLNMKSFNRVLEVGQEYATWFLYLGLLPGEYPNFPSGSSDGTHFQEMGALEMGKLITEGIEELEPDSGIAVLISALAPFYDVNVDINIPDAGLYTLSGKYPAGSQVTLKTRLENGYSFSHWEDDSLHLFSENNLAIFTMQPQNYSFKAILKDCNETAGGSAILDNCGICSGGTTGNQACTKTFQCETACEYSGTIEYIFLNGTTRIFINTESADSPFFLLAIQAVKADMYQFGLVYSSPDSSQILDIYVNDNKEIENFEIEKTENWTTVPVNLNLQQGTNYLKIVTRTAEAGMLLDQLVCYSDDLAMGVCKVSAINENRLQKMMVYPNPFKENFNVTGIDNMTYQIYDITGVLVETGKCSLDQNIGHNLIKGLYFFCATNDSILYKEIIQKL